ncbi:IS30 family transposase [Iamia sp. SCSIO 61187]|uniref:IS30 family transposase n=2 Tax=Iamia sp. SCSIO 61187 TaxID=2722752 RepID=UPI001C63B697|nr:IS30 family transposase [Iamia sp. SCSIO 61187]QYG91716.1 IS30 family transposase [Iamia sp. SCSIO 61187]QYG91761.1 IS30 family transposase [Iamia sp. SCSIO 61187]QYG91766.1 IS30 family transposase [Iamia sp. SCSIO 61187]QYG91769.1 IS30 family transposase [Iamia sp. SCSIO 61187]QYG93441.1 IS30 family transposase [Iamia sp. SCSIO 61187]
MAGILTHEQKQLAFRLRGRGWRLVDIAREIGCTAPMVGLMVRDGRFTTGVPDTWEPRPGCLSIADREEIFVGIRAGDSLSAIARAIGRVPSVVTREVAANGGRQGYSAWAAHQRARHAARRPKPCKLGAGRLLDEVTKRLEELWSPDEIARRLPLDFPDDPEMRVSHETIYQSLFVQGRGELRRELARCLRSGRASRKKRGTVDGRGRIPGMVNISERPAEADDRAVPGHWEGDLILGEASRSAVGTLVERTTRLVLLLHLDGDRSAVTVEKAMRKAIATLPDELVRSITWDQGAEMSTHASFTTATGIPIYFCDPHSPWQRGSNENTNGLLRQYLPKGTDLSKVSASELVEIQRSLNGRPRKTLGYLTPSEAYAQVVAATA